MDARSGPISISGCVSRYLFKESRVARIDASFCASRALSSSEKEENSGKKSFEGNIPLVSLKRKEVEDGLIPANTCFRCWSVRIFVRRFCLSRSRAINSEVLSIPGAVSSSREALARSSSF